MGFDLSNYEEVKDRIPRFWKAHPAGAIRTTRLDSAPGEWVVHAALYREGEAEPFATGLAHEVTGSRGVNQTSALENCETSAIGRALANGGFSSGPNRPSREEMGKAKKVAPEAPRMAQDAPKPGAPTSDEDRVKAAVAAAVAAEKPDWDQDKVKAVCRTHYPVAVLATTGGAVLANAAVIAGTILDLEG